MRTAERRSALEIGGIDHEIKIPYRLLSNLNVLVPCVFCHVMEIILYGELVTGKRKFFWKDIHVAYALREKDIWNGSDGSFLMLRILLRHPDR